MTLKTAPYVRQKETWPGAGRHLLAQFDETSIVVYQAYRPAIGRFAAAHQYFGGGFSLGRMSWIKPNFLWMMYRSGWGTKEGQEVTLAVRIRRRFFDALLVQAVPSSHDADLYADAAEWSRAVRASSVRLQWDPDHSPSGGPLQRRALQLGLRGEALSEYARESIVAVEDISGFVAEQRPNAAPGRQGELMTPAEDIYVPADQAVAARLKLSP